MAHQRQRRDMFMVPIIQELLTSTELPLPYAFMRRYENVLPRKVNLCFPNGDIFECQFCKRRRCIIGVQKIYSKFMVESSSVFMFETVTNGDYMVTIIGPPAVEINYPSNTTFTHYRKESSICGPPLLDGLKWKQLHNWALLNFSARHGTERTIDFLIDGKDVLIDDTVVADLQKNREKIWLWENGWCLYLNVGEKAWEVEIRRIGKICKLSKGWEALASDLDLQVGDSVTLVENGNPYHFNIFVYRGLQKITKALENGKYRPMEFVHMVDQKFLTTGSMFVPKLMWLKAKAGIDESVELAVTGKGTFKCFHNINSHILYQFGPFIQHNLLEVDDMLLFRKVSPSRFIVNIFDRCDVSMYPVG